MSEFPHMITLETESEVSDGTGGYVVTWTPLKEVEAHVQPISGDTYFIAQQNQSRIKYKIFLEFENDITSSLRVIYGEEVLKINAVIDQGGLNEILVLMCESGE